MTTYTGVFDPEMKSTSMELNTEIQQSLSDAVDWYKPADFPRSNPDIWIAERDMQGQKCFLITINGITTHHEQFYVNDPQNKRDLNTVARNIEKRLRDHLNALCRT